MLAGNSNGQVIMFIAPLSSLCKGVSPHLISSSLISALELAVKLNNTAAVKPRINKKTSYFPLLLEF